MSIIFMIKCNRCKIEFDQGDTNMQKCPSCTIIHKEERKRASIERYNKKQIDIVSTQRKTIIKKCKFCKTDINAYYGRLFCTHTCRTKFGYIPENIQKTEKLIERLNLKINKLKAILTNN